jgi:hypothetical protein
MGRFANPLPEAANRPFSQPTALQVPGVRCPRRFDLRTAKPFVGCNFLGSSARALRSRAALCGAACVGFEVGSWASLFTIHRGFCRGFCGCFCWFSLVAAMVAVGVGLEGGRRV